MRTLRAILMVGAALVAVPVSAAEIVVSPKKDAVGVYGDIERGDDAKFEAATKGLPRGNKVTVWLDSAGGYVKDGMNIGIAIKNKGWETGVAKNTRCLSACATIWLAGSTRYAAPSSHIGFHGVYSEDLSGKAEVASTAVLGAYMSTMGLSYTAIFALLADTEFEKMHWLSGKEATELGISYKPLRQ